MAEKWIQKAIKSTGGLRNNFPTKAKGGFSVKELHGIVKSNKSTVQEKRRANLALTLRKFK